jgi:hypothetical protein
LKKIFKYISFGFLILWIVVTSFISYRYLSKSYSDFKNDQLIEIFKRNPTNFYSLDEFTNDSLFINRIRPCKNSNLLEFVGTNEKLSNNNKNISSGIVDLDVIEQFKRYYENWPAKLKYFCNHQIAGVYSVKNLTTSAITFVNLNGCYIIFIDEEIFKEKANDWASRIESTAIELKKSSVKVLNIIEADSNNTRGATLENLLLHEIGHCIGEYNGLTPGFSNKLKEPLNFYKGVYSVSYYELKPETQYDQFKDIQFYSKESQISVDHYIELLKKLQTSPFPTMYSTKTELEFFAEYFYYYIHCVVQNKPFKYQLVNDSEIIFELDNKVNRSLSENRFQVIKNLIE